jgi:predicted peptidase
MPSRPFVARLWRIRLERHRLRSLLRGATLLLGAVGANACRPVSTVPTGTQVPSSFDVTRPVSSRGQFLLYLPPDYNRERRWPLLVFLHGAGERGTDLVGPAVHGPPRLLREGKALPFVVVSPQVSGWNIWTTEWLDALIDDVTAKYHVDPDRIYLAGLSMGGYGAWQYAMEHPEKLAALVPVSAGAVPSGACALTHLPIWVFHGAKDDIVPLDRAKQLVDRIAGCKGTRVTFTIYPNAGHDAWTETFANPALYEWLAAQRREKREH